MICLCVITCWACSSKAPEAPKAKDLALANLTATAAPAQNHRPLVAFLNDGDLWVIQSDGTNRRQLVAAPDGEAIQDFVWSPDGSRIYFSSGFKFSEVSVQTGNAARAGVLNPQKMPAKVPAEAPEEAGRTEMTDAMIERLEMAGDGRTIIVHLMGQNDVARLMALTPGEDGGRDLTIDEYNALLPSRSRVVRDIGECSVSPDGGQMLFKRLVDKGEELFVANVESGTPVQITHLYQLNGFEGSVATEGGRRVMEAAWSPDGSYVIFNPMQSCSALGLCYGRLYLVRIWGGTQLQLSKSMMVNVAQEWNRDGDLLIYDDGSKVVAADTFGHSRILCEGNRPKWQPVQ